MKIEATAKEMADFVKELQNQPSEANAEIIHQMKESLKEGFSDESEVLTEEIVLLTKRKEWLDEMRKSGKLYWL